MKALSGKAQSKVTVSELPSKGWAEETTFPFRKCGVALRDLFQRKVGAEVDEGGLREGAHAVGMGHQPPLPAP